MSARRKPWSEADKEQMKSLRASGMTWHAMGLVLLRGRTAMTTMAQSMGLTSLPSSRAQPPVEPELSANRDAFPPGHPVTWGAITTGTVLDGERWG